MRFAAHWAKIAVATLFLLMGLECQRAPRTVAAAPEPYVNPADVKPALQDNLLTSDDIIFVHDAQDTAIKARSLSRVALVKSSNPDVREYAKRQVDDHTATLHELVALIQKKQIAPPSDMAVVEDVALTRLNEAPALLFDQAFVETMVKNDEREVAEYQGADKIVQDLDLRAFVDKTLPLMQKHLQTARDLEKEFSPE